MSSLSTLGKRSVLLLSADDIDLDEDFAKPTQLAECARQYATKIDEFLLFCKSDWNRASSQ
jgi:hypothetical protein